MTQPVTDATLARPWALVAFDLDDTLAPSKAPLPDRVGAALRALLETAQVAVISGGAFPQFELQLLGNLHASPRQLANLHLMPTCGTRYARFEGEELVDIYDMPLSDEEWERARSVLEEEARRLGLWTEEPYGEIIEHRGSQVTFSALGQDAPIAQKRAWDPDGKKRSALAQAAAQRLPDLEVRSGGSTSVDVTAQGIDKAFGMHKLVEQTGIAPEDMLFIGDRLDPGGNDYPVKEAGWATYPVAGWEESPAVIGQVIAANLAAPLEEELS